MFTRNHLKQVTATRSRKPAVFMLNGTNGTIRTYFPKVAIVKANFRTFPKMVRKVPFVPLDRFLRLIYHRSTSSELTRELAPAAASAAARKSRPFIVNV